MTKIRPKIIKVIAGYSVPDNIWYYKNRKKTIKLYDRLTKNSYKLNLITGRFELAP